MAQCATAFAMMICMIAVYGERLPTRKRFCVGTKVPIEILGVEASLVQWSTFWYAAAFFLVSSYHRVMFYLGLVHAIALLHLSITLYNNFKEVDWVDLTLAAVDILLTCHSTIFMIWWQRISETAAVLIATAILWFMSLYAQSVEDENIRRKHARRVRRARRKYTSGSSGDRENRGLGCEVPLGTRPH